MRAKGEKQKKVSFYKRILKYVEENGPCSVLEVVGGVGKYVTAAQSKRAHERLMKARGKARVRVACMYRVMKPIDVGRRNIVKNTLWRLSKKGLLSRVDVGVYDVPDKMPKPEERRPICFRGK